MNLTVIENKAIQALPVTLQPYVAVRFKKPLKDYDNFDLEMEIKNMLVIAFSELGITTSASDQGVLTFLRETLIRDFRRAKFAHLTFEEIRLYVSNGIRGDYGTFNNQLNTINIQNIHYWIKRGLESDERKRALEAFNQQVALEDHQRSEVPLQVKIQRSIESILNAFDYYRENGKIQFCGFAYYDILNDLIGEDYKGRKTLVTDPATRKAIFEKSEEAFLADLRKKKFKAEASGNNNAAEQIGEIMANVRESATLQNKQKELLLGAYFDKLIANNTDLREVLRGKLD